MIIPIFIPHDGCPNDCAFCNQRTISGSVAAPDISEARNIIEEHLSTMDGKADQIAFFGGSFTGIEEKRQNEYLSLAYEYIKKGMVESIRLSTRPDYIDRETVERLISYGVKNIELGAQSMNEDVLIASRRGHSVQDVENAAAIITDSQAVLGLQMMIGLPKDSFEKCMHTAHTFKKLGAEETRIYPTVVLRGTHLAHMFENGEYVPCDLETAVSTAAVLYRYFKENTIEVLRIGLPDSDDLRQNYVAGAYHPSLGEMVMSRDIRNRIEEQISGENDITLRVNPRFISKVTGNKRCNIEYFAKKEITLNVITDKAIKEICIEQ